MEQKKEDNKEEEPKFSEEVEKKYNLITNQLQEVVGTIELKKLLSERDINIYWGTATTGKPHFGYFVPIFKISDFLKAGCHVTILFADLHAYLDNMKSSWELLAKRCQWYETIIKEMIKLVGVPLDKLKFVRGTSYQLEAKYTLDMYKLSAMVNTNEAKHAGAEVVKKSATPLMSSLLYSILQALDEEYLKVDAQFGGVDQRKIFMFARTVLPKIGYKKRCHLMNPLIPGLSKPAKQGEKVKMSATDNKGKIDFDDSPSFIKKKIKSAYSVDGQVDGNGLLAMLNYVLFRWLKSNNRNLVVPRAEKYGGEQTFKSYEEVEKAFAAKELVSGDLKKAISSLLIEFLEPLRKVCQQNQQLLKEAYPALQSKQNQNQNKKQKNKGGKKGNKGNKNKVVTPYRIDLRVGKIVDIKAHPKSEKLFVEQIDVGEDKPRTIISGLASYYKLEELKGKKLLVMCNLQPVDIGKLGIVSNGMVVAASKGKGDSMQVKLVGVPDDAKVGERVTWSNLEKEEPELPTVSRSRLKKLLKALTSDDQGKALWKNKHICQTSAGDCVSPLKNAVLG